MRGTYKKIKDNQSKTGRGRRSWERMEYLDNLLAEDATVTLSHIQESQVGDMGDDLGEERRMMMKMNKANKK